LFAACILGATFVAQADDADTATQEIEDVEVIEEISPADLGATGSGPGPSGILDFFGRLHHGVVHLPIAWLFLVVLMDLATFFMGRKEFETPGFYVLGATLLSFLPAVVTGLVRQEFLGAGPDLWVIVGQHRVLVFVTFALTSIAFLFRWMFRDRLDGTVRGAYLALIVAAGVLVMVAGHWGGKIVYGPDYLPF
jgi:uncharacterized membrane protein